MTVISDLRKNFRCQEKIDNQLQNVSQVNCFLPSRNRCHFNHHIIITIPEHRNATNTSKPFFIVAKYT